jgi:hypothetical protein
MTRSVPWLYTSSSSSEHCSYSGKARVCQSSEPAVSEPVSFSQSTTALSESTWARGQVGVRWGPALTTALSPSRDARAYTCAGPPPAEVPGRARCDVGQTTARLTVRKTVARIPVGEPGGTLSVLKSRESRRPRGERGLFGRELVWACSV